MGPSNMQIPYPLDTILHIGAGVGHELADYLAAGPESITLVEPNPEALKELRRLAAGQANVDIIPAAVTENDGTAPLQVLNFAALSSLREPTGLRKLFPGVRIVAQPEVDTISAVSLLGQLELDEDKTHWLIVDAPGEEQAIFQALLDSDQLHRFCHISLHSGNTPLYEGGSDVRTLLDWLAGQGYRLQSIGRHDPDRPAYQLILEAARLEQEHKMQELDKITRNRAAEISQLKEIIQKQDQRIRQLEARQVEQKQRQQKLVDEMIRAEAQIDLIENVLLKPEL